MTVDRIMISLKERAKLWQSTSTTLVEMESHAVGDVAQSFSLPFLAIRCVTDTSTQSMPDFTQFTDEFGAIQPSRVTRYLGRHPGKLASLMKLGAGVKKASVNLSNFGVSLVSVASGGMETGRETV